jgi:uncharacterized membrane protein YeaQ/YmgE (transglycosylase-associated protein family)
MLKVDGLGWFTWLVVGALAGWLATAVIRTNRQPRLVFDVVLGILGASLGGMIFTALTAPAITGFSTLPLARLFPAMPGVSGWSILVAFIAALTLLGLRRLWSYGRALTPPHRV